jgi:hypothetical protein
LEPSSKHLAYRAEEFMLRPRYRYPLNEDPSSWDEERVSRIVDLLTSQDLVTWTIVSVSFATQGILIGFYFQLLKGSSGRVLLPLVGLLVAVSFTMFVARSNRYMWHYMRLLFRTGKPEFDVPPLWLRLLMWTEENIPSMLPRVERLARWVDGEETVKKMSQTMTRAASATAVLYVVHGGWIALWLLILTYGNLL